MQSRLVSPQKQLLMVCFQQITQNFGVFDEFLYFNFYKTLAALRDVFGYSENIFSWEKAKSGFFTKIAMAIL